MKLLALLHSPPASGSDTTVRRISSHLTAAGHSVVLVPEPADPAELPRIAKVAGADALMGTHAYLSGKPFLEVGLPYVLILGGTDVNEMALDPECFAVMTKAIDRAAAVVAFNDDFMQRCTALWPQASGKLHRIPQGVRTQPSGYSLRRRLGIGAAEKIFLLPAGLRVVKDPLFLLKCVAEWHEEDPRIHLVIAGPSYEPEFEGIVRRRCGSRDGIHYVGALPRADLHAAMREATAVLNTSLSECSPNAVLEAMDLGRPVIARDIPGNTCLVEHDVTGLVFGTPEEFRRQAERLVDDELLTRRLARRGQQFVRRTHHPALERHAYATLLRLIADDLPASSAPVATDWVVQPGGARLQAETFGNPQDPAILLIAGTSASMLAWDAGFCTRLAAGSRFVIRYDHRDTGRSASYPPGAPPYTLRDLVADAIGVLDGLGLDSAHLVGISMGGMIAQLAALDHPRRVESVALLSTSPGGSGPDNPDLPSPSPRVAFELDDIPAPDWTDRGAVIDYQVALERPVASRSRPFDEDVRRDRAGRVFDRAPDVLPSTLNHLLLDYGEPWRHRLGSVRAATLVVHGAQDPIFPVAHGHALAREIPGAHLLVLDQTGHELAHADWEILVPALLRHTDSAGRTDPIEESWAQ